jgi:hypothetical protein
MGIRKNQWVKKRELGAEYYLPADFEMNNKGKDLFLISLKEVSMPEGSASIFQDRCIYKIGVLEVLKVMIINFYCNN